MDSRKKILIITNLFPTEWEKQRGMFNYQQFQQLAKSHELVVLIPVPFPAYIKNVVHKSRIIGNNIETRYVKFYYIPKFLRFSHGISLYMSMRSLIKEIKKEHYDIVLGSWAFPDGYVAVKLAKSLGVPCIIKVHGSDVNVFTKTMLRRRFIQHTLNAADYIISVSNDLKNRMKSLNVKEDKIQVIYNGLDKNIFYYKDRSKAREMLNLKNNQYIFLYVGNLKTSKGIGELIQAFKAFIKHHDATLYIIGDGERIQWIESEIHEHALQDYIYLQGSRGLEEISQYMSAANVLVLPSYSEGVPNVLLEAKGCGLPVVATRVGGIPEITNSHDSVLIEKESEQSLLNGMLEAYGKEWDPPGIAEQAQDYSWEKNGEMLNQVICNVC